MALFGFRDSIVDLYFAGYSLKLTHLYLKQRGVNCSYSTFTRWVKVNINFGKIARSDLTTRSDTTVGGDAIHPPATPLPFNSIPNNESYKAVVTPEMKEAIEKSEQRIKKMRENTPEAMIRKEMESRK